MQISSNWQYFSSTRFRLAPSLPLPFSSVPGSAILKFRKEGSLDGISEWRIQGMVRRTERDRLWASLAQRWCLFCKQSKGWSWGPDSPVRFSIKLFQCHWSCYVDLPFSRVSMSPQASSRVSSVPHRRGYVCRQFRADLKVQILKSSVSNTLFQESTDRNLE